jgi:hypothetical protein
VFAWPQWNIEVIEDDWSEHFFFIWIVFHQASEAMTGSQPKDSKGRRDGTFSSLLSAVRS